jgi:zinc transporter 9
MTLSSSQLRLISTIGMGVLVGTSLIVIIPEGIETVYSAGLEGHSDLRRGLHTRENGILTRWAPAPAVAHRAEDQLDQSLGAGDTVIPAVIEIKNEATPTSPTVTREPPHGKTEETSPNHEDKEDHHERDPPTFYIGLSLILGFILMFLVDKLPRHASDNLQSPPTPRHISLDNLSRGLHSSSTLSLEDGESESFLQAIAPTPKQSRSLATTTGLVIHAAADGIAMGASASSTRTSLGFIVFIAILVHKAPAAFGLTSVLLKQGLSKRAARGHLIIFSLASPVGSLSTWLLVNLLGGGQLTGEKGQWWTGMLLLFSAGTFLLVPFCSHS